MEVALREWPAPSRPSDHELVDYFYIAQTGVVVVISLTLRSALGHYTRQKMVEYMRVEIRTTLEGGTGVAGIVTSDSSWKETKTTIMSELPLRCPLLSSMSRRSYTDKDHMMPTIWSKLPEELLIRTIAMLPLQCLFRARSVCRVWASLIYDPNFCSCVLSMRAHDPPLCIFSLLNDEYLAYNPTSNAWHVLPASFIPTKCDVAPFRRSIIANAGCFVLLRGAEHGSRSLFVVNPLNLSERRLPSLPYPQVERLPGVNFTAVLRKCDAWLVVNKSTGAFNVLCVEQYSLERNQHETCTSIDLFHLYDSRVDSWTMKCEPMPDLNLRTICNVTMHKEHIYCLVECCLVRSFFFYDKHYFVYRVGEEGWEELDVEMPENLCVAHLLECQGSLMLVGGICDPELILFEKPPNARGGPNCLLGVDIWRLSLVLHKCVIVQTMPDELLGDVSGANPWLDTYLHHTQLYSLQANGTYIILNNVTAGKTVMCDVSKGIWWLLPPHSLPVSKALLDNKGTKPWFLLEISMRVLWSVQ